MKILNVSLLMAILAVFFSCDKEEEKEPVNRNVEETPPAGKLAVSFENTTISSLFLREVDQSVNYMAPDYFGIKFVAVEVVDTEGRYYAIWINSACENTSRVYGIEVEMTEEEKEAAAKKIREEEGLEEDQEVNVGTYKSVFYDYHDAQGCDTSKISSFFDLSRTSEQVNSELNSQGLSIPPGTYTQVSLRLCTPDTDTNTFKAHKFQAGVMTEAQEVTGSGCGVTGTPVTPIKIAEGESATVKISYDLSQFIKYGQYNPAAATSENDNCIEDVDNDIYYCSNVGAGAIIPSLVTSE